MGLYRIGRRQFIAGSIATGLLGTRAAASAPQQTVKIGLLQTLSGSATELGQMHLLGARIASSELNRSGGINGSPVELVVRDTKLSATEAVTALHDLAGLGVNMVLGDSFGALLTAEEPLARGLNMVLITPSGSLMSETHELYVRNFFRCGTSIHMYLGGMGALMAKVAPDALRWGTIIADQIGSHQSWDIFSRSLKRNYPKYASKQIEIVDPVVTKVGAMDYRNQISDVMAQKLDGIYMGLVSQEAVTFMQQARPFGLFKTIKVVADNSLATSAGTALKQNVPNNFWSVDMWNFDRYKTVPMARQFVRDYNAETKTTNAQDVHPYAAVGHTSLMCFASAAGVAKSVETDNLIDALENNPVDCVFGPLRFRKDDHQVEMDPGYLHVEPQETAPGYHIAGYETIPWQDAIEPPSPGVVFKEE